MSVQKEFSKYANQYNSYNIIQQLVAKALVRDIKNKPKNILELGCGSGQIYKNISWNVDSYTAIDFSKEMCDLHPKNKNTTVSCYSFDSKDFLNFIKDKKFDLVLSSSALQWSKDLKKIIKALSYVSNEINAVLFTSNTFRTIQNISDKKSPILDIESIKEAFSLYYNCTFDIYSYNLEFSNKRELFDYIKKSGVSGESNLSFKEAKHLFKTYSLNYLEFEVVFIKAIKL
ncbi:MAG: methyltransferase domain-containing protein [Campylobacteraceae bacterium]|nr:methyltransferase domain-containing protein [Campylobacteraceae bacterium]